MDQILKTASNRFKLIESQEASLRKERDGQIEWKIFILKASLRYFKNKPKNTTNLVFKIDRI